MNNGLLKFCNIQVMVEYLAYFTTSFAPQPPNALRTLKPLPKKKIWKETIPNPTRQIPTPPPLFPHMHTLYTPTMISHLKYTPI